MHNSNFMKMLNSIDKLFKKLASFGLFESFLFENKLKKFSFWDILHDEKELFGRFNNLIELDDIGVSDLLQDVYLSGDSFNICDVIDFAFL